MTVLFQATSVWLTAAMLLVQAVCPGLALGCGCQQVNSSSCTASEESSCCCADDTEQDSAGCPHCDKSPDDGEPAVRESSVCYCGELAPSLPPLPHISNSSEVTSVLNWISDGTACVVMVPVLSIAPARSQVPSSESLVPKYTQLVYCVWVI